MYTCSHTEFKSDNNSPELNVTLDNLLIQLRPQVTPVWYKFGEAAGIEKGVLDGFAKQCTPEDCVMEMLDLWLKNQAKQPTWRDVAKVLKIIHLPQLALEIEKVYVTGTSGHCYCLACLLSLWLWMKYPQP